jgi:ketosteroid isomerase-like protein
VTHDHVDVIRAVYERWAEGDFTAGFELYDPHVVLIQGPEFPEAGTYLGPQAITGYMRHFLSSWERITIAAEEIIEAGDSVVVKVLQRGSGTGSGAVTELPYFHVWTFRGDKVVRWENFRERARAMEAVGLS